MGDVACREAPGGTGPGQEAFIRPSVSSAGEVSRQSPPPRVQAAGSRTFYLGVERSGTTAHLRLTGEFDVGRIGRVEAAFERLLAEPTRRIVFDLSELSALDFAGLHTILRASERARDEAFDVVVVRPRGSANLVFTMTRAGERLTMVDHVVSAAKSGS